ncbi:mitochondrial thiamine pyrophosphate carrier 1 [Annulohypoxylon truncatum]|uniref:mitochondrial thiamine pyrophosphate carrier 1 n=1 Tax=Annulohypoxylon truncatum TaxID=327061 RepID=UPI00200783A5|nr:mitochondrial thiamine pyrophosphate carrier 1 [Annulohypoxylon truncatum]KAI1213958.1 mitochondrial thiamine pyrophosphate carrier 1 [Annulohypoxylon truncatum]
MSKSDQRLQDEGSRLQVVTAGATAGLMSRFVVAPLDVVKIRLQLQSHSLSDPLSQVDLRGSPIYKGTIGTFRHIVANEGVTALWKGNVPAELMYVAYASIQFTTYRSMTLLLQRVFAKDGDRYEHKFRGKDDSSQSRLPKSVESFISGASAGATATAATYPLDLLRTRFAAQGNERVYDNLRHAVADINRDEGIRGFFRGLSPALAQIVPFMGLFFAVYEGARLPLGKMELPWGSGDAAAGIVASVVAKTGVFPLDLVRKRIQVQGPTRSRYVHKNIPEYRGTVSTVRQVLQREGVRGLYRGLTVSLIKAAPASAVTMWTYERVLNMLISRGEKIEAVQ